MKLESIRKMNQAAAKLQSAVKLFQEVKELEPKFWDASHFINEINEILSSDNGEAGLINLIQRLLAEKG